MGVMTGTAVGADKEHGAALINSELQDKGFLVTSTADIINWARTGSLHWMRSISVPSGALCVPACRTRPSTLIDSTGSTHGIRLSSRPPTKASSHMAASPGRSASGAAATAGSSALNTPATAPGFTAITTRSAPRTTSEMPWKASSTTTANW